MWRIFNKLFGFDYVYVRNTATSKIVRVKVAPNNERYFQPYSFQVNIIPNPIKPGGEIINGWHVTPLTNGVTAT